MLAEQKCHIQHMSVDITIDEHHILKVPQKFGKYEYVRTIGNGSFSAVVLCRHTVTKEFFACKVVSRALLVEEQIFDRFEQEVRVLQSLKHPNIVHVENIVFTDDYIYLIMEYCQRGELFRYIVDHGMMSETEVRRMFKQICSALAFVHDHHIAHRDLKPENILLDSEMNAKLADFGLCHATTPQKLLMTPCGSPFYAPPEIINNVQYDGQKADIWSLGVVLYTMATGSLPWTETNQTQLFLQIQEADITIPPYASPPLQQLLGMMLQREPERRPTCKEILELPWLEDLEECDMGRSSLKSTKMMGRRFMSTDDAWKATHSGSFKKPFQVRPVVRVSCVLSKGSATASQATMSPNLTNLIRRVPPSGKRKMLPKIEQ